MNPEDINLEEMLEGSKMKIDSTANSYGTYVNHLRVFLSLGKKEVILQRWSTSRTT
jgi:hypothetical protein